MNKNIIKKIWTHSLDSLISWAHALPKPALFSSVYLKIWFGKSSLSLSLATVNLFRDLFRAFPKFESGGRDGDGGEQTRRTRAVPSSRNDCIWRDGNSYDIDLSTWNGGSWRSRYRRYSCNIDLEQNRLDRTVLTTGKDGKWQDRKLNITIEGIIIPVL